MRLQRSSASASPTDPKPAYKKTLALLLAPIVLASLSAVLGTALAPSLLSSHPLLLLALNPAVRHLVLATNSVDALPFFAVALASLFFQDPFYYLIGRGFGADAIRWIERKSGGAGKLVRFIERLYSRAGIVLLFLAPAGLLCVLAGATRMRPWLFVVVNVLGTLAGLTLVRVSGAALADPIESVREFVLANVLLLTVVSVIVVGISSYIRRRRARRLGPTTARDGGSIEV